MCGLLCVLARRSGIAGRKRKLVPMANSIIPPPSSSPSPSLLQLPSALLFACLGVGVTALLLLLLLLLFFSERVRSYMRVLHGGLGRLVDLSRFETKDKGRRTINIYGFPINSGHEQVKQFLESHTGVGTVYALKVRSPRVIRPQSKDYAIVQFTDSEFAKIILSKTDLQTLRYGGFYLEARELERDIVFKPRETTFQLSGRTLHYGCQVSKERLSVLFISTGVEVRFSNNMKRVYLFLPWGGRDYKLEFSYESISEIQLFHSRAQRKDFLLFLVAAAPRIYVRTPQSEGHADADQRVYFKEHPDDQWIRTTDFTPSCGIGQSFVICLELPYKCTLPDSAQISSPFKEIDGDLHLETGHSYSHSLDFVPIVEPGPGITVPYKILFKVNHMVQNGILSGPTLDDRFFRLLSPDRDRPINYVKRAVEHLSFSRNCVFDPATRLLKMYSGYGESSREPASGAIQLERGVVYVHRVQVTPSKIYFCGPEVNLSNRVVRNYIGDLDNFIRVSFVDEEGDKLRSTELLPRAPSAVGGKHTEVYRRILSTLRNGIVIADKKFEFLAFSNSQIREHSVWMFASRTGLTAADMRKWMGNFSSIRNVAKFATRLGQSLSSSTESPIVAKDEVEIIPDVKNKAGYLFSDGIGKISAEFADEVARILDLTVAPSAFQIRFGGYKGVVAVDPRSKKKLSFRDSMSKFESDNMKLDVLAFSKYQACYLNRQVIILLSTLGVRDEVFEMKQAAVLEKLERILTDTVKAQEALEALFPGEIPRILIKMLSCGYKPDAEPFLSMMLQMFKASKFLELRTKTRILIPKGRAMMGCLDETRTLEYGQVFVQASSYGRRQLQDSGLYMFTQRESGHRAVVVKGRVIVTKNPCLHPGDVRTLMAVDVPGLHHMVDCVVFPQKGERPHPNECSGSDLDGDVYFVSWDPELIPPRQVRAMDYTAAPVKTLDHDVTIEEVQEYFTDYIVNDNMGIISNAHMAFADKEEKKAESKACLELARLFSIAVDFPKTGVSAQIPRHLQVKEYPDFMERVERETYESQGVIGKLFRAVKDHAPPPGQGKEFTKKDAERCYDPDMEAPGFKDHLDDAFYCKQEYDFMLGNLMDLYGIKTEAEILVGGGGTMKISKLSSRSRDVDSLRLAVRNLKKEAKGWFFGEDGNYDQDGDVLDAKASAWYHVTYHPGYWGRYNEGLNRPHFLSFPWCVGLQLIRIKQKNMRRQKAAQLTRRVATALRL